MISHPSALVIAQFEAEPTVNNPHVLLLGEIRDHNSEQEAFFLGYAALNTNDEPDKLSCPVVMIETLTVHTEDVDHRLEVTVDFLSQVLNCLSSPETIGAKTVLARVKDDSTVKAFEQLAPGHTHFSSSTYFNDNLTPDAASQIISNNAHALVEMGSGSFIVPTDFKTAIYTRTNLDIDMNNWPCAVFRTIPREKRD